MASTRLSLHRFVVAIPFVATFSLLILVLLRWYDFSSLSADSGVLFSWSGTAYVVAYSVAEAIRRRSFFSAVALVGALVILAVDIARHGNLLLQTVQGLSWFQLSSSSCMLSGSSEWLCQATMFLTLNAHLVTLCAAAGVLLALGGNLAGFLRS